jgi:23S rRNA (uracil1939-C5)-methyltransferase
MHLTPDAQRSAHAVVVKAALRKIWPGVDVVAHAAGGTLRYRARARLHVRASGGRAVAGMHARQSHEPVEVDACIVLDPALERARRALAPLLEGARGRGDARIALGALETPRRAVLDLAWTGALPPRTFARVERATLGESPWAGARIFLGSVTRPAVIGDPTPWMRGADERPLRLAPGGFAQASEAENARLVRRVADLAGQATKVLELFAGAGNLSVMLAPGRELVAVESEREACEAARANLAARSVAARVVEADAEAHPLRGGLDLVVLDPPRAGARRACEAIAARGPKQVLYVSCDPQTLARDLGVLSAKYAPRTVETFEMFPGTSHVETVVHLEKRRR